jgi:hypothetical protein
MEICIMRASPERKAWRQNPYAQALAFRFLLWLALCAGEFPAQSDEFDFFEKHIRPVLVERCYDCHNAESEQVKGGLMLDSREGMLKGGASGMPAIVPGDPEASLLIEAIRYENEKLQMPRKGPRLTEEQVEQFTAWIKAGAPDPRTRSPSRDQTSPQLHWAFQPPKKYTIPQVKAVTWPESPIDNFILVELEKNGLIPSPKADKHTLIRRATFDLIGLPPTQSEVEAFLQDHSPDAFARVVNRLLDSPRYGERYARYWLDLARYSDTKGYVYGGEETRTVHSHVYRDWVIRAFNEDLPYDQFLLQQIAADQMDENGRPLPEGIRPNPRLSLAAMGFLTLGRRFLGVLHDIIDDRIDVVTRGVLGLTVSCARCHDHKFDPIPTKDYYSLYGVFSASTERTVSLITAPERTEAFLAYESWKEHSKPTAWK